jgi:REP element-mobilizing transposase RayT
VRGQKPGFLSRIGLDRESNQKPGFFSSTKPTINTDKLPRKAPGKNPPLLSGSYYHFYNRGVNREKIFFKKRNWRFFLQRMHHYFKPEFLDILAYCLMPNHYHILVYLKSDNVSKSVMQPFGTSYTKAINSQQKRVGPLYQGPFRARHVNREDYLAHVSRYIHLNPVRAGLVSRPADWMYSSYRDYVGLRKGTLPEMGKVLEQFDSREAYRRFVEEGVEVEGRVFRETMARYVVFD